VTIILGIDPGSRITGYGLIRVTGRDVAYLDSGCIRTTSEDTLGGRLLVIFKGIRQLTEAYKPDEVAIEQVFMHQNANTALKLGHARGAAMVACADQASTIAEYAPRQIKLAVAGYGAADKEQVKQMVMRLLMLKRAPQEDASDALAVALCHSHVRREHLLRSKVS
jgi:crossover junction endodeoxyribonuclease RuvC